VKSTTFKVIAILSILVSHNVYAQYEELAEIMSVDVCQCITKIPVGLTQSEIITEFEVCVTSYISENLDLVNAFAEQNGIEFSLEENGEELGEQLGLNLIQSCPQFMEIVVSSINREGEEAYTMLLEGNSLINTEGCNAAITIYDDIVAMENVPDSTLITTFNNLGYCKNQVGDYYGAISDLNKALSIAPNFSLPYLHRGDSKSEIGDYEGAIADFSTYLTFDPSSALVLNKRGLAHYNSFNFDSAYSDYYTALEIDSSLAETHYNLGLLNNYNERYQDAVANFLTVYKIDPSLVDLSYYISQSYIGLEDYDSAIQVLLEDSLTINDEFNLTEVGYSFYMKEHYGEAITYFDQAIALNDQYYRPFLFRAYAKQDSGLYELSLEDFESAYALSPEIPELSFYKGYSLYELERYEEALAEFSKAIELSESYASAYDYRARIKLILNDVEGAIEDYSSSLTHYPSDDEIYKERGEAYVQMDNIESACTDFLLSKQLGNTEVEELISTHCSE